MRARDVAAIVAVVGLTQLGGVPGGPAPVPPSRALDHLVVFRPAAGLGAMVAAEGSLWADDRVRQRLVRIDPRTGRVLASLPVDGRVALSAGRREIWAIPSSGEHGSALRGPLLRIDTSTGSIRDRIPLGRSRGRRVIAFGVRAVGSRVWVWGPHDVLRVNARTGRIDRRIVVEDAHGELSGLAASGPRVVVGTADGHLINFDARSGRRTGDVSVPERKPVPISASGPDVLYAATGAVTALRVRDARRVWRRQLGYRAGAVTASDGRVWVYSSAVHERGDRVTALRADTGAVITSGVVPAFGATSLARIGSRVSIATAGGRLLVLTPAPA